MRRADVSVHVDQRRLPCVLEPSLLLTHAQGPTLALRLVAVVEPWLTRSFWQALDNSELLTGRMPSLGGYRPMDLDGLRAPGHRPASPATDAAAVAGATAVSATALSRWIQLRERTDESAWVLRWVGDRIAESQLRDVEDLSLFDQFELMQASLELRAEQLGMALRSPWQGIDWRRAALDALSLSAVLEGALVLCAAGPGGQPPLVSLAAQLGFQITDAGEGAGAGMGSHAGASGGSSASGASDGNGGSGLNGTRGASGDATLFATERQLLREALARAGLATLAQQLPPMAVLHVVARSAGEFDGMADVDVDCDPPDPWQHAQVWWYLL